MSSKDNLTLIHGAAAMGDITRRLYVIRWMEHEYEAGWGENDQECDLSVYSSRENAHQAVENQFQDGRSLSRAGDYFIYPSGPDDAYNLFEIYLPQDHRLFRILKTHSIVTIPRIPIEEDWRSIRREIILEMQNPISTMTVVPFVGLKPKPITEEPFSMFFGPKP